MSSSPKVPDKGYNIIYSQLVDDDERDIIGLLAYCFYKQSKQAFIKSYQEEYKSPPSDTDLQNHVKFSEMPSLTYYKDKAESIVRALLDQAAQEKQDELEAEYNQRMQDLIKRYFPEELGHRTTTWFKNLFSNGLGSLFGNFLTTIAIILLLACIAPRAERTAFLDGAKRNFVSGFAQVLGVKIKIPPNFPSAVE